MTGLALMRGAAGAAIARLCEVPEPLTVTDWAARYRQFPETSTSPGPYDPTVAPYQRRPQDCLADPDVDTVVLCWAAQTGKSTVIEHGLGYRIHRAPAPMVVVQPKIDAAESWAKERLVPMVVATPVLRERVRLGKGTDSTLRYKRFPGGFLWVASAQSATELASRSAPFVLCDEVDRYEPIPGEGNPVEIVARRQGAADVGLLVVTSTPRDAETTLIWPYLEGGTMERFHLPCPGCGEPQPLDWKNLKWGADPLAATYVGPCCGVPWDEREKRALLLAGDWVAERPDAPYPSFHLNALYSPFAKSRWGVLAQEFERAKGKPADLQVFVNTRLAELWEEQAEQTDGNALAQRLEPLPEGVVPLEATVLTAGVDVQANRLEARLWAWRAGLESWLVEVQVFPGDPQREPDEPGSVWAALDGWLARSWPLPDGRRMGIACALVDSGFATTQVYRYTKRRAGRRIFASKGLGGDGLPILGKPTVQTAQRVTLWSIGVDQAKTEFLRSQLYERQPGPGYVHLPDWIDTAELDQLTAEKRLRRVHKGRVTYEWRKKSPDTPNEALDCRIMARAALEIVTRRGWRTLPAATTAPEPEAAPDDTTPRPLTVPTFRPRQKGWMSKWR